MAIKVTFFDKIDNEDELIFRDAWGWNLLGGFYNILATQTDGQRQTFAKYKLKPGSVKKIDYLETSLVKICEQHTDYTITKDGKTIRMCDTCGLTLSEIANTPTPMNTEEKYPGQYI